MSASMTDEAGQAVVAEEDGNRYCCGGFVSIGHFGRFGDDLRALLGRNSKMNWPLVLTCFLLPQSCILGASRVDLKI
ncbi:hypothetical protein X777_05437 [Ooceraea biroi]|uniref:Uncharacterized protein n=1 Tax=Ooceraea biroi TaxID=2015173 RepID=A0A026X1F1_OOCBI|nr:hypothetical protein X777_05437 [Ooceraea biroi]